MEKNAYKVPPLARKAPVFYMNTSLGDQSDGLLGSFFFLSLVVHSTSSSLTFWPFLRLLFR